MKKKRQTHCEMGISAHRAVRTTISSISCLVRISCSCTRSFQASNEGLGILLFPQPVCTIVPMNTLAKLQWCNERELIWNIFKKCDMEGLCTVHCTVICLNDYDSWETRAWLEKAHMPYTVVSFNCGLLGCAEVN